MAVLISAVSAGSVSAASRPGCPHGFRLRLGGLLGLPRGFVDRIEDPLIGGSRLRGIPLRLQQRLDLLRRQFLAAVLDRLFQHGVLGDLLRDHLLQFQTVQLQNRHHLDQPRSQDLLLRDL